MNISPSVCNSFQTVLLTSNDPILPSYTVPELDNPRSGVVFDGLLWIVCTAGTLGCYHLTGEPLSVDIVTTPRGSVEELVSVMVSPPGWTVRRGPIRVPADLGHESTRVTCLYKYDTTLVLNYCE